MENRLNTKETLERLENLNNRYYFGLLSSQTVNVEVEFFLRDGLTNAIEILKEIAEAEDSLKSLEFSRFEEFNNAVRLLTDDGKKK